MARSIGPLVKRLALQTGTYRLVRGVKRHVLDRTELKLRRQEIALFRALIPTGALCFDVGANSGAKSETLLAAGAKVVAFEPHPEACLEARALRVV